MCSVRILPPTHKFIYNKLNDVEGPGLGCYNPYTKYLPLAKLNCTFRRHKLNTQTRWKYGRTKRQEAEIKSKQYQDEYSVVLFRNIHCFSLFFVQPSLRVNVLNVIVR